jgi:hypothetical protein
MNSNLQQELDELMTEIEESDVKDFTFELVNAVWDEFSDEESEDIDQEMVKAYEMETRQSLEIFNPELDLDISYMKRLLNILEK